MLLDYACSSERMHKGISKKGPVEQYFGHQPRTAVILQLERSTTSAVSRFTAHGLSRSRHAALSAP
jgi:hypothetical protein